MEVRYCHYMMTPEARMVVCNKQVTRVLYTTTYASMVTCPDCKGKLRVPS